MRLSAIALGVIAATPNVLQAAPISIQDPLDPNSPFEVFHAYENFGPSSIFGPATERYAFAIRYVDPDGKGEDAPPTTAVASQSGVTVPLSFVPFNLAPKNYAASTTDLSLNGQWTIELQNESDTLTVLTPSIDLSKIPAPIVGLAVSNVDSTTPMLAWDAFTDPPDEISIAVRDLTSVNEFSGAPDIIGIFNLSGDATSYVLPDGLIEADGAYNVQISSTSLRDSGYINPITGTNLDGSTEAVVASFFDLSPAGIDVDGEVFLPQVIEVDGLPQFVFNNLVEAGVVEFYDPIVAIGYDYSIGEGNPNFASVLLPEIGDSIFDLLLPSADGYELIAQLIAGEEYFFGGIGVSEFRVLGIETGESLDPNDPTAFVTGLSFFSDGQFTGTMTPITFDTDSVAPVPLPAGALLLLTGLLGFGVMCGKRTI